MPNWSQDATVYIKISNFKLPLPPIESLPIEGSPIESSSIDNSSVESSPVESPSIQRSPTAPQLKVQDVSN